MVVVFGFWSGRVMANVCFAPCSALSYISHRRCSHFISYALVTLPKEFSKPLLTSEGLDMDGNWLKISK